MCYLWLSQLSPVTQFIQTCVSVCLFMLQVWNGGNLFVACVPVLFIYTVLVMCVMCVVHMHICE